MNHFTIRCLVVISSTALVTQAVSAAHGADSAEPAAKRQLIVLKFDDVAQQGNGPGPRWQRLADYLEAQQVKSGFGVICESLEKDNPAYFKWIKDHQAKGMIEFWLHGYHLRTATESVGEFEKSTYDQQLAALTRSEQLAKEKLGFAMPAFGPHWSGTTVETEKAVQATPEIKLWLYGPKDSKYYTRESLVRVMGLEIATGVPDYDRFVADYERFGVKQAAMTLQGHPNLWDDARWETFTKILAYLKSKDCDFVTPSQYLATRAK